MSHPRHKDLKRLIAIMAKKQRQKHAQATGQRLRAARRAYLRSHYIAYGYLHGRSIARMEAPGTMRLVDIDQVLKIFRARHPGAPKERAQATVILLEELYAWNCNIKMRLQVFSGMLKVAA